MVFGLGKKQFVTGENWVFAGVFCEKHLSKTVMALGKAMTTTVQTETVSIDEKCMVEGCGNHIGFVVYRDVVYEVKQHD